MKEPAIPPESRRAMFRAVVAATAAGERETGVRRVARAMLATDSAAAMCARAGLSRQSLTELVDPGFTEPMASIASLPYDSWPLSEEVRVALLEYVAAHPVTLLTPPHILLGLLAADGELAAQLRDAGLTEDILREAARAN
jgi:hypothetical protein